VLVVCFGVWLMPVSHSATVNLANFQKDVSIGVVTLKFLVEKGLTHFN